jgi:hypothetical protein
MLPRQVIRKIEGAKKKTGFRMRNERKMAGVDEEPGARLIAAQARQGHIRAMLDDLHPVDRFFSFHHPRFHLEPKAPLRMPAYNKGNVIRGGLGSTFRRIVCHGNCREPEACELRSVCPYTAVFQPFVPEGSEKMSKNRDIPRPFVIKPPLETKETYLPGERLSFDVVLVGRIKEYLPYFIVTFKELSQAGLGRNHRQSSWLPSGTSAAGYLIAIPRRATTLSPFWPTGA